MYIELLLFWFNFFIYDLDIVSFCWIYIDSWYFDFDVINLVKWIQNKLSIQESLLNWIMKLYLYFFFMGRVVFEWDVCFYDKQVFRESMVLGWDVCKIVDGKDEKFMFSWIIVFFYGIKDFVVNVEIIIKLEFDSDNIWDMLDKFKDDGRYDFFYY